MHCNNLRLVLGLGLVRVSSRVRIRVKVRVSVMVRVGIRTSWVVNFALFRCYRPVIYTRPLFLGWCYFPSVRTEIKCNYSLFSARADGNLYECIRYFPFIQMEIYS